MQIIEVGRVNFKTVLKGLTRDVDELLEEAANRGVEITKDFFETSGPSGNPWDKLSEFTIEKKGHDKPLVDTGALKDSIDCEQIDKNNWKVFTRHPVAAIHEFGAKITVTEKMRKYLHTIDLHLSKDTKYITIPERPFMRPSADQLQKELDALASENIGKHSKIGLSSVTITGDVNVG